MALLKDDKTAGRRGLRRIEGAWRMLARAWSVAARFVGRRLASSLTRRIIVLNLAGLVVLLLSLLYLNQFREGLIDARVQSLQTQGEIIAGAISASASVDTDSIAIIPTSFCSCRRARAPAWSMIRWRRSNSPSTPSA